MHPDDTPDPAPPATVRVPRELVEQLYAEMLADLPADPEPYTPEELDKMARAAGFDAMPF